MYTQDPVVPTFRITRRVFNSARWIYFEVKKLSTVSFCVRLFFVALRPPSFPCEGFIHRFYSRGIFRRIPDNRTRWPTSSFSAVSVIGTALINCHHPPSGRGVRVDIPPGLAAFFPSCEQEQTQSFNSTKRHPTVPEETDIGC